MLNILVAEDEKLARLSLIKIIRQIYPGELHIFEAQTGGEAVDICLQRRPNIVFMDIQMPGMNGLDASEKIILDLPSCDIFLVSAYDYFHYAQKAVEIGVKGYILKPPQIGDVRSAIERSTRVHSQIIGKKHTPRQNRHQYPHDAERMFHDALRRCDISQARLIGEAVLCTLLNSESDILIVKEQVFEYFFMLNRLLLQLRYYYIENKVSELSEVFTQPNYEAVKVWAWASFEAILAVCEQNVSTGSVRKISVLRSVHMDLSSITLKSLAEKEGVSKSYICRAFKEWVGENFQDYLTKMRLEEAKRLLTCTQYQIDAISRMVGYADGNYFCRVFKSVVGITPTDYRESTFKDLGK